MLEQSLKQQAVRGVGWSFADSILGQGVTFIVGLVLARLLSPDDYGLIGIITIFITVFNAIVDSGFSNSLIRKAEVTGIEYNTMFIVNFIVSILLFLLLFITAPYVALFFRRPELIELSRVMGVVIILNAISIVQNTVLTKELNFKAKTKASLISSLISGVIGIVMAYAGCSIWALVGQQISRQLLYSIGLWRFVRWRPSLKFSVSSFQYMWNFGWKILVSGLLNTIWNQIYQVVIGRFYTPYTLGLYTRAEQFGNICSSNLTSIVQRVSFPVLSKLQDDKIRLKGAYKRIIKTTMLITLTLMLGMAGCAKPLILFLLGEKWQECIPFLQILSFNMMFYPLHSINLNMLQVQGRSDLFLKLEVFKKIVAVGPILLGVFVNIYWMLIGSVFTNIFALYLNAYYSGPYLKYSIWEQVRDILPSLLMDLTMFAILLAISFLPISLFVMLPSQIIIGAVFTLTICEIRRPEEYLEIKGIAMPIINRIFKR